MTLREYEVIVVGVIRIVEVVAQVLGEQNRHEIGSREGRCWVTGAGRCAATDAVDSQLLSERFPLRDFGLSGSSLGGFRRHDAHLRAKSELGTLIIHLSNSGKATDNVMRAVVVAAPD